MADKKKNDPISSGNGKTQGDLPSMGDAKEALTGAGNKETGSHVSGDPVDDLPGDAAKGTSGYNMGGLTPQPEAPPLAAPAQERNYFQEYGDQISARNIVGTLLKFSKGDYLAGQDEDEIDVGTVMVANMDQLLIGWIRWEDQKPAEQRMGLLVDGFVPAKRDQLGFGYKPGDTEETCDRSDWELNTDKTPRDPWQFSNYLVMKDPKETEPSEGVYTFATSSTGGLNAIGDLCKIYGRKMREHPNEYPLVALKVGSYNHSNKEFGRIKVPVFQHAGWIAKASFGDLPAAEVAAQLTGPSAGHDDGKDIPF